VTKSFRGASSANRSADLAARYGVENPRAPKLEPWGLTVAYVFDPSGVLWHFAELPSKD